MIYDDMLTLCTQGKTGAKVISGQNCKVWKTIFFALVDHNYDVKKREINK